MNKVLSVIIIILATVFAFSQAQALAQTRERSEVSVTYKWKLEDLYGSDGYCNGSAYDVHPYILLNYNGQYDDVSTLAHELGHAMHSYYSNKNQPYPTAAEPFNKTMTAMNRTMDEIEAILDKKGK